MLASSLVVALTLFTTAKTGDPAANVASAKAAFERAEKHYEAGEYRAAQHLYTEAYTKSGKAALLFNIGQCHMALEEYDRAAALYERYLQEEPNSPYAHTVSARLSEAKSRHAERVAQAPLDPQAAPMQASAATGPGLAGAPDALTQDIPIYERWWFWTAIGAVAVGGVVAAAVAAADPFSPEPSIGSLDRR